MAKRAVWPWHVVSWCGAASWPPAERSQTPDLSREPVNTHCVDLSTTYCCTLVSKQPCTLCVKTWLSAVQTMHTLSSTEMTGVKLSDQNKMLQSTTTWKFRLRCIQHSSQMSFNYMSYDTNITLNIKVKKLPPPPPPPLPIKKKIATTTHRQVHHQNCRQKQTCTQPSHLIQNNMCVLVHVLLANQLLSQYTSCAVQQACVLTSL